MGRRAGLSLTRTQRQQLQQFMKETKDKREYRAAGGLLMRAKGTKGLHMKKPTGRKTTKADAAKPKIAALIDKDPQAFGYLKGRWVLRDISRELKKEGIDMHWTSVGR